MKMMNIIYTNQMPESVAFYEVLGLLRKEDGEVNQWWNEFPVGDATLALHWNQDDQLPQVGNPELNFSLPTDEFMALYERIAELNPSELSTLRGLGQIFTVTDPNGVRIQINEIP